MFLFQINNNVHDTNNHDNIDDTTNDKHDNNDNDDDDDDNDCGIPCSADTRFMLEMSVDICVKGLVGSWG